MSKYFNVTVTIVADSSTDAESIVEHGIDKQGHAVIDICADEIKDEQILKELKDADVAH